MVGVAGKGDLAEIQNFVNSRGVDAFVHAIDDTGDVWMSYDVVSQPAVVFLNDDGTFTTHVGAIGVEGLTAGIEELLAS